MKRGLVVAISILFAVQIQLIAQENIIVLYFLTGTTINKTEMDRYALFRE